MTVTPRPSSLIARFRERLEALPQSKTEDSLLLRILVQSLVIVGIIATDVAAETQIGFWAIPLSIIVGAAWSWYHRHERSIWLKFLLAMGMLIVLAVFWGNLVAQSTDSRLAFTQLLIQLQQLSHLVRTIKMP